MNFWISTISMNKYDMPMQKKNTNGLVFTFVFKNFNGNKMKIMLRIIAWVNKNINKKPWSKKGCQLWPNIFNNSFAFEGLKKLK